MFRDMETEHSDGDKPKKIQKKAKPKKQKSDRGPGRPRTQKIHTVHYVTHGIIDEPSKPEYKMELVYENPKLFSKLVKLYKDYDVNEISMIFYKDRLEIVMNDFIAKSKIFTTIHGKMMVRYFCGEEPLVKRIKRTELEKILKTLDKCHTQIIFIMRNSDYNSKLYITVTDSEIDYDGNYEINFINNMDTTVIHHPDETNYPVKFVLSGKKFKKLIGDIYSAAQTMTIRKDSAEEPLCVCYEHSNKVNFAGVYKDPAKIELECRLEPDDIFSTSASVSYIKPFSNSNIGEKVKIFVDKFHPLYFITDIDNKKYESNGEIIEGPACTLKILTEIHTLSDIH